MAPPFLEFCGVWSGHKIKLPGGQSVHRKLLVVTSNTLSQSFGSTFFELVTAENPDLPLEFRRHLS